MQIIFSNHAKNQMVERDLSEDEIISTILRPDKIVPQSKGKFKAVKLIKKENKKYLMVVIFCKVNSIKKVVTVFLTSKIKKYLI